MNAGRWLGVPVRLARTCFCDLQSWRSRQQLCSCSVGRQFRFRFATWRQFSCGYSLRWRFCERDDRVHVRWIAHSIRSRLRPHRFDLANWEVSFFKIVTWVNFQLMIVNLLPCYPLDGAKMVRAMIDTAEIDLPRVRVETAIKLIGHMVAFAFIGSAWICGDLDIEAPIQPIWLPMLLIGITLLFTAKYSLHVETNRAGGDWDELEDMDYGSIYSETAFFDLDDEVDGTEYSQWLQEKQEARREIDTRIEMEEEKLADKILDKLHKDGISSISDEEQLILQRVSERIRRRREEGVNR